MKIRRAQRGPDQRVIQTLLAFGGNDGGPKGSEQDSHNQSGLITINCGRGRARKGEVDDTCIRGDRGLFAHQNCLRLLRQLRWAFFSGGSLKARTTMKKFDRFVKNKTNSP
jgi:hypothetical protein